MGYNNMLSEKEIHDYKANMYLGRYYFAYGDLAMKAYCVQDALTKYQYAYDHFYAAMQITINKKLSAFTAAKIEFDKCANVIKQIKEESRSR